MSRHNGALVNNEHLENVMYGFATGAIVGGSISGFEFAKVKMQTNSSMTLRSMCSRQFVQDNWRGFASTVPAFAMFFGGACAIEFSVNDYVKQYGGPAAGLCASALSGAAFLTPADHLMFRKEKSIRYLDSLRHFWGPSISHVFTGFTPMVGREFLFGLSVLYSGPFLTACIQRQQKNSNDQWTKYGWSFVGTFLSALVTTTVSQPLDTITRKMQIAAFQNNYQNIPSFFDVVKTNLDFNVLYRGFAPRLVLASVGAASIGTLFKFFKEGASQQVIEAPKQEQNHGMR